MATQLGKFSDAYATMTVAVYEPLILRWVSRLGLRIVAGRLALRLPRAMAVKFDGQAPTGLVLGKTLRRGKPDDIPESMLREKRLNIFVGSNGKPVIGRSAKNIPTFVSPSLPVRTADMDLLEARDALEESFVRAASGWASQSSASLGTALANVASIGSIRLPHLWPGLFVEEALSPIGIAHFYRQHYFNQEEGVGPIEEAFTIAPLESLEVIYQVSRRQVHEEVLEQGSEVVSESAVEEKNLDEVSDKVSSMVQSDFSASMSASTSGGIGVWSASASASVNFGNSTTRGREVASRKLKEITTRASERITKSMSIKVRDLEEVTRTNTTRRVIQNNAEHPVSYGLRRVLRRVRVKVQDLGPRMVWQLYVRNPGQALAQSEFVHFKQSDPIAVPDVPPGVPAPPAGGTDTGSVQARIEYGEDENGNHGFFISISVQTGADREVAAVRIDSMVDLDPIEDNAAPPAPRSDVDFGSSWDAASRTYTARLGVHPGTAMVVNVSYTYTWEPSQSARDAWDALVADAREKMTQELLIQQFEQQKATITERSKVKPRPANDLRREERIEVIQRTISYVLGSGPEESDPTPLEIESFSRYFDVDATFMYTFPSWWRPRWGSAEGAFPRPSYQITAESEPAPLGSSLGWMIQLDGDRRRSEFLNSPWVRVCMPIRAGREREAIHWLAKHIEGEIGLDVNAGPLSDMLEAMEDRREQEDNLGVDGPDYVTVSSTPGAPADPLSPEGVYPIVDDFSVTVPTDGFVYDELLVST